MANLPPHASATWEHPHPGSVLEASAHLMADTRLEADKAPGEEDARCGRRNVESNPGT